MPRTPFVAGNWKMNMTKATAIDLAKAVAKGATFPIDVGVAPPLCYLDAVGQALTGSKVWLGAQNVYCEKCGAFTGEVSVEMLQDLGVKFVLNGHSERRHVLNEPPTLLTRKAKAIHGAGLMLVHCVGEKIEERDADKTLQVVEAQLNEIKDLLDDPAKVVIAYEPVWAIGTGRTATDPQAQEVQVFVRESLAKMRNRDFADRVRIVYGGSMNANNAAGLMDQADVDGGLIGGASLKADSFLSVCKTAADWFEKESQAERSR